MRKGVHQYTHVRGAPCGKSDAVSERQRIGGGSRSERAWVGQNGVGERKMTFFQLGLAGNHRAVRCFRTPHAKRKLTSSMQLVFETDSMFGGIEFLSFSMSKGRSDSEPFLIPVGEDFKCDGVDWTRAKGQCLRVDGDLAHQRSTTDRHNDHNPLIDLTTLWKIVHLQPTVIKLTGPCLLELKEKSRLSSPGEDRVSVCTRAVVGTSSGTLTRQPWPWSPPSSTCVLAPFFLRCRLLFSTSNPSCSAEGSSCCISMEPPRFRHSFPNVIERSCRLQNDRKQKNGCHGSRTSFTEVTRSCRRLSRPTKK